MGKRSLTKDKRDAINALFDQGVSDVHEVVSRLEAAGHHKVTEQQVGGMLTLWKRSKTDSAGFTRGPAVAAAPKPPQARPSPAASPASRRPANDPPVPPDKIPAGDGFGWNDEPPSGGATGTDELGFGDDSRECHVSRIGPTNDGYLGTERELTLDALGKKYGSGTYEITLFVNGIKVRTVRKTIAQTYGPPKFPRAGGAFTPRLVREDDQDRPPDPFRRPGFGAATEANEAVQTIKAVADVLKDKGDGESSKILDRALTILSERNKGDAGGMDEAERRFALERKEREAKAEQERKDADAAHKREMDRMREEFANREREQARIRADQDKRDADQRAFIERVEKEREKRQEDAIAATNNSIAGLQANMDEEIKKARAEAEAKAEIERQHQKDLAELRKQELERERERLTQEMKLQRDWQEKMYELQLKSLPRSGESETTTLLLSFLKDALIKADDKAGRILDLKQLEQLSKTLGPDQAKQLLGSFVQNGGLDISKFIAKGPAGAPGAAAEPVQPAATPAAEPSRPDGAAEIKGDGMNGIAQQVYGTPFFKDLVEVWGGHLRMGRSPFLFADQMAQFMLADARVGLFYNYMASKPWAEFLPELIEKVPESLRTYFRSEKAELFFDQVIEVIAKRIEADHIQRGIMPTGPAEATPKQGGGEGS